MFGFPADDTQSAAAIFTLSFAALSESCCSSVLRGGWSVVPDPEWELKPPLIHENVELTAWHIVGALFKINLNISCSIKHRTLLE